jgi:hypothetical protein
MFRHLHLSNKTAVCLDTPKYHIYPMKSHDICPFNHDIQWLNAIVWWWNHVKSPCFTTWGWVKTYYCHMWGNNHPFTNYFRVPRVPGFWIITVLDGYKYPRSIFKSEWHANVPDKSRCLACLRIRLPWSIIALAFGVVNPQYGLMECFGCPIDNILYTYIFYIMYCNKIYNDFTDYP